MVASVLTYIAMTRDSIAAFCKDVDTQRQIERIAKVCRNIAQGGPGDIIQGAIYMPAGTFDDANETLALATDYFQVDPVGLRTTITDSATAAPGNFAAVIAGGGANVVPAWYDGADWRIG